MGTSTNTVKINAFIRKNNSNGIRRKGAASQQRTTVGSVILILPG